MSAAADRAAVLRVRGLTVSFGAAEPVVDGVDLDLAAGQVVALVGESGSGKSVSAMSVLGLLPGAARVTGSIRLQGRELVGADPAELRSVRGGRIGTVFQEPGSAFDPVLPIGRQIEEAIRAHRPRGASRGRVAQLLGSVGLREPERIARSYPHELSGGQLQRAMIAMAISCDPVALIADEPTTALDVTVQAGVLDLLRSLASSTAILLITHDMGVVADLADEVVVLREGRVVERGATGPLFDAPQHPYTRRLLEAVPSLAAPRAAREAPSDGRGTETAAVLEDAEVVFRRRGTRVRAVDGVGLTLHRGEVVGLVGESGSGKSTIGRALLGLVPLSAGRAIVEGVDLGTGGRAARRRVRSRIGTVFQDPASSLNPRNTVGESVAEPLRLHTKQNREQRAARVAQLLDDVRLPPGTADRYPHELSGGQRQRVAIARALALEPVLLVADEPTSALDVSVQAAVLDLIEDLQARHGFACLFISHDLAVVRRVAGTVVVLHEGRVVERGPVEQVLAEPTDPYTRRLLTAAPVADPVQQAVRRERWRALEAAR